MRFAIICRDKPGAIQTRLDNRAAHLNYVDETGIVELGGPFLEDGQMVGSLLILEADNREAAEAWAASDPYARAGLFENVTITEWKKVIG